MDPIRNLVFIFCFSLVASVGTAEPGPTGFEDPVLLGKVMKGDIVVNQVSATKTDLKSVVRFYFNKVSPEAFVVFFTSHKRWIGLIPEIKDAKTLSANKE